MVELLLSRYLKESYSSNSYVVNVYVVPGPQAIRLARFSREDLENNKGPRVECFFRKAGKKSKAAEKGSKRASKKTSNDPRPDEQNSTRLSNGDASSSRKRKRHLTPDADDGLDDFIATDDIEDFTNELRVDAEESEPEDDEWMFSMGATAHVDKKSRRSGRKGNSARGPSDKTTWDDGEIISLLSD